jgi:hypothetical protein
MLLTPVQTLTQFCHGYRLVGTIADQVFQSYEVPDETFQALVTSPKAIFAEQNTYVGPTGMPNEVKIDTAFTPRSTAGEALLFPVPNRAINAYKKAGLAFDPREEGIQTLRDIIDLTRELRLARLLLTSTTYPAANRLAAATVWTNAAANPIDDVIDLLGCGGMPFNTLVFGLTAFQTFRAHPRVIAAINPTGGNQPTAAQIAALFADEGVTRFAVGRAKYDGNPRGKAVVWTPVWGDGVAAFYQPESLQGPRAATFGGTPYVKLTGGQGRWSVSEGTDDRPGVEGVTWVKVATDCADLVADSCLGGYLGSLR